jgi:hypothetical protein
MQEVRSVIESGLEEEVRRPAPPPKGRAAKEGA